MVRPVTWYTKGLRDGIPIALGYLAVAFTLGIAAVGHGLTPFQAFLMSLTNNTSAGQFAALGVIAGSGSYLVNAMTQAVINLRYCLMSAALSQKIDPRTPFFHRWIIAFDVTDEVFALSVSVEGPLSPWYSYGLMTMAIPGWAVGTLLGGISGNLLPARVLSAMGVALFGMFLAIILPPARKNRVLAWLIPIAMISSLAAASAPGLRALSPGMRVIVLTLTLAGLAATFFPLPDQPPPAQGDADAQGGADAPDPPPRQGLTPRQAPSAPAAPHAQSNAGTSPKLSERGGPA
jgi:predicted branched-subunit amino acid permease